MSRRTSTQPLICVECKRVPLTPQEEATKNKRCYWCELDYVDQLRKSVGEEMAKGYPLLDPEFFGRTQSEIDAGRPRPQSAKLRQELPPKQGQSGDAKAGFQKDSNPDNPDWAPRSKAILKEFGLDVDNPPPITIVESYGNEGTKLRLELTAGVDERHVDVIQQMLDQTLVQIIRVLTFGVKHNNVMDELRNMMRPRQSGHPGEDAPGM